MTLKRISIFAFLLFFLVISCPGGLENPLTSYNHAQVRIRNCPANVTSGSMKYKAAVIDEYSESGDSGDKVIKTILPTNTPIALGSYDTFDINWTDLDSDVFVKVYWGGTTCYDHSTDFFEVSDGEVVTIDLSTDTDPYWRIFN